MRQFDAPKKSRKKAGGNGLAEALDELENELDDDSDNDEGDRDEEREERDEEEEGEVIEEVDELDGCEEMTLGEIQELDESVKPVRLVLTKVSQ